jgi:hypothetical protein
MSIAETIPADYLERARALKAKFFPRVVATIPRESSEPGSIKAVVFRGRVYGPFNIADDFRYVSHGTSKAIARQIIRDTAEQHGLMVEHLIGARRDLRIVRARHEAMARVYEACPHMSMVQIGKVFHRDHTSVLSAVKKLGVWRGVPQ